MEDGCQLHAPAALPPGKNSGIHRMEGLMAHRAGVDVSEKRKYFDYTRAQTPDGPPPPSLYRLSYPGLLTEAFKLCMILYKLPT
jgi:hypothetical protein